jgi:hypothetical protein
VKATVQTLPGYRSLAIPQAVEEWTGPHMESWLCDCTFIHHDKDSLLWSQHTEDGTRAVFKMYHHRGPVSWWRERRFRFRVQREFDSLTHLEHHGIPCSKPLFWSFGRSANHGRYEVLATREIPVAVPLVRLLASLPPRQQAPDMSSLFQIVRRMHDSGLYHGSLYLRNVLVTRIGSQDMFHIIDTPKAVVLPYSIVGRRLARTDLSDLTEGVVAYCGPDWTLPLLLHYGMDRSAALDFLSRLRRYRSTKLKRNLQRAESVLQELLSKVRHADV